MTVGRFSAWGGKLEYTTGELARLIYCDPLLHKLFGKGGPPPKVKHWQYERVRKAAPTFADRVGRSTGRGRPVIWRLRPNQYLPEIRQRKPAERAMQRKSQQKGNN
jgi:hypothetical protein